MKKETKMSVVNGFDNEKFEAWCLKENKNPKNDLSVVEYLANVLKDKCAKEFLEKFEKGEVTLENLDVRMFKCDECCEEDDEEEDEDILNDEEALEEKFELYCEMIKAISNFMKAFKDVDSFIEEIKELDNACKYAFVEATVERFGQNLADVLFASVDFKKMSEFKKDVIDKILRGE